MKHVGFCLVVLGVLTLVVLHLLHFTMVNALLFMPLAAIVLGCLLYIYGQKRESKY
jgi:hypothetical protein